MCEKPRFKGTYKIIVNDKEPNKSQIIFNGEILEDSEDIWQTLYETYKNNTNYFRDFLISEVTVDIEDRVFSIREAHKKQEEVESDHVFTIMENLDRLLHMTHKAVSSNTVYSGENIRKIVDITDIMNRRCIKRVGVNAVDKRDYTMFALGQETILLAIACDTVYMDRQFEEFLDDIRRDKIQKDFTKAIFVTEQDPREFDIKKIYDYEKPAIKIMTHQELKNLIKNS